MTNTQDERHLRKFSVKLQDKHPALSEWHEPGADTWEPLWDGILESDVFMSWQRHNSRWVLRCVGAPGSGKTTFSALVTKSLKIKYAGAKDAVASVFVRKDVTSSGAAFIEDVLESIFNQLWLKMSEDEALVAKHHLYLDARMQGHRDLFRVQLIKDALQSLLSRLEHAFLIIDDFDRCSPAADLFLENELYLLAAQGLKVLLTSRDPCLKELPKNAFCDSCVKESGEYLSVYWICAHCEVRGLKRNVLCPDCREGGKTCGHCGNAAHFLQPFDHVELNLGFNNHLQQFINRNLEMEHGDLGLGSTEEEKPPRSDLGGRLTDPQNREALTTLCERILDQADGNVSLALLRLHNVHHLQSVDSILSPLPDVLPANIVSFFHAGMQRIEEQSYIFRDLGLKVIAAVAHYDYQTGLGYEALDRLLRNSTKMTTRQQPTRTKSGKTAPTGEATEMIVELTATQMSHRSLEEIIHASGGFIIPGRFQHRPLRAYCQAFYMYVKENYNESLVRIRADLDFDSVSVDPEGSIAEVS